jgi:hypothetical protein
MRHFPAETVLFSQGCKGSLGLQSHANNGVSQSSWADKEVQPISLKRLIWISL